MATPSPTQIDGQQAIRLLRHLFHNKFSVAENLAPAQRPLVPPPLFFGWIDRQLALLDAATECEAAGVPVDPVWEFVMELVTEGLAPLHFQTYWYLICLPDRPEPKHKLVGLHANMVMTYEDGTKMIASALIDPTLLPPGMSLNDAVVAQSIRNNVVSTFVKAIVDAGVDGMHDMGSNFNNQAKGLDGYALFCGTVQKALQDGFRDGQLSQDAKALVQKYLHLAMTLLAPQLPPSAKLALEANKQRVIDESKGKVSGGWEVG